MIFHPGLYELLSLASSWNIPFIKKKSCSLNPLLICEGYALGIVVYKGTEREANAMKVSNNAIEGRPALEELLSRKVGVLLHIIELVDKMDLSVREKSVLLRLTKDMYLSLAKNQEFQSSVPIDKPS